MCLKNASQWSLTSMGHLCPARWSLVRTWIVQTLMTCGASFVGRRLWRSKIRRLVDLCGKRSLLMLRGDVLFSRTGLSSPGMGTSGEDATRRPYIGGTDVSINYRLDFQTTALGVSWYFFLGLGNFFCFSHTRSTILFLVLAAYYGACSFFNVLCGFFSANPRFWWGWWSDPDHDPRGGCVRSDVSDASGPTPSTRVSECEVFKGSEDSKELGLLGYWGKGSS